MEILIVSFLVAALATFAWLIKVAWDKREQREQARIRDLDLRRQTEEVALLKEAVHLEAKEQRRRRSTDLDVSRPKFIPGPPASETPRPKFISASRYIPDEESFRERPAERSSILKSKAKWIAPGETAIVQNIQISSGMFYLGTQLISQRGDAENCLIDPTYPIAPKQGDKSGSLMGYYPSYGSIAPAYKRAYLEWLADGRCDPEVSIGYVFLFFYGLERRVFIDRSLDELPTIIDEVQRLLGIYGANRSFSRYANTLLDTASLLLETPPTPEPTPKKAKGFEISYAVRRYLGSRLVAHGALDADDALLWALSVPDVSLKPSAERCFREFVDIWRARFEKRFPKGLQVDIPKRRLVGEYSSASNSFKVPVSPSGTLPDIAALSKPVESFRGLLNACTKDLQPYYDYVRQKHELRDTIGAAVLLPKEVLEKSRKEMVDQVRKHLDTLFDDRDHAVVPVRTLFTMLGTPNQSLTKVSPTVAAQIATSLDKLDIGFEPDRRYGPGIIAPDARAVLFRAAGGAPVDSERTEYRAARAMVEVSSLIALKDGQGTPEEFERIQEELRRREGLTANEQQRLQAHALALLNNAPQQRAVLKRLLDLPEADRMQIVHAALSVALVDGQVSRHEVTFLEDVHKALNLPQEEVYAAIHRRQSGDAAPRIGVRMTRADLSAEGQTSTSVVDHQAVREALRRTHEARQDASRAAEPDRAADHVRPGVREDVDPPPVRVPSGPAPLPPPGFPQSEQVPERPVARPQDPSTLPRRTEQPEPTVAHVDIDEEKLAQIEIETAEVSSLLASIFVVDDEPEPVAIEELGGSSRFEGLQAAHGELLAWVLANDSVTREAFEEEASKYKLLPDGAIEAINEWGVETIGEIVLDGDDVIMIDEDIRGELRELEAS